MENLTVEYLNKMRQKLEDTTYKDKHRCCYCGEEAVVYCHDAVTKELLAGLCEKHKNENTIYV